MAPPGGIFSAVSRSNAKVSKLNSSSNEPAEYDKDFFATPQQRTPRAKALAASESEIISIESDTHTESDESDAVTSRQVLRRARQANPEKTSVPSTPVHGSQSSTFGGSSGNTQDSEPRRRRSSRLSREDVRSSNSKATSHDSRVSGHLPFRASPMPLTPKRTRKNTIEKNIEEDESDDSIIPTTSKKARLGHRRGFRLLAQSSEEEEASDDEVIHLNAGRRVLFKDKLGRLRATRSEVSDEEQTKEDLRQDVEELGGSRKS